MAMWILSKVSFLVQYNDYVELAQYRDRLKNSLITSSLKDEFGVKDINFNVPILLPGPAPIVELQILFGDSDKSSPPRAILNIDRKMFSLHILLNKDVQLSEVKKIFRECLNKFKELWNNFNEIAERRLIERLGFVASFEEQESKLEELKQRFLKNSIHRYFELRFSEFKSPDEIDALKVIENTFLVPNLFITPAMVFDPKEHKLPQLKGINLVSDIACQPTSKGITEPANVPEAMRKFVEVSAEQLKKFEEVTS
jgi:hypothetical protein